MPVGLSAIDNALFYFFVYFSVLVVLGLVAMRPSTEKLSRRLSASNAPLKFMFGGVILAFNLLLHTFLPNWLPSIVLDMVVFGAVFNFLLGSAEEYE